MAPGTLNTRVPPVALTALCAALMWAVAALSPALTVRFPGRAVTAAFLLAGGVAVVLAGVVAFRRASTTVDPVRPEGASALVTSGVYRASRNPMYVGFLLALAGWAFFLAHPLPFLLLPLFVAYMNRFQIGPEERALRAKFGESFDGYARSTPRWL